MENGNVLANVTKSRLDEHIVSCERFRGIAQWISTGVIAATISLMVFMASQILAQRDAIKSIENVVLQSELDSTNKIKVLTEAQIARAAVIRDDVSRIEGNLRILSEKLDKLAAMLHEHEVKQVERLRSRENNR